MSDYAQQKGEKIFYFEVLLPLNISSTLTYSYHVQLAVGNLVLVDVRGRKVLGLIVLVLDLDTVQRSPHFTKIKNITQDLDCFLKPQFISFLQWVARYNLVSCALVCKMSLAAIDKRHRHFNKDSAAALQKKVEYNDTAINLNVEQNEVSQKIINAVNPHPHLIHGVTGSGKTEVYLSVVKEVLKRGGQVLILMPEILLSTQMHGRFTQALGSICVWHSGITPQQKSIIWHGVQKNHDKVVVGARSALFLPFANLQLIIVDEEHDSSFKQEEGVLYNGRDMAVVRSNIEKIPILLISATPSIESMYNARSGKYHLHTMSTRYSGVSMPEIVVVDINTARPNIEEENYRARLQKKYEREVAAHLAAEVKKKEAAMVNSDIDGNEEEEKEIKKPPKKKLPFFHPLTIQELEKTLNKGKQSLIFINRRGYATVLFCPACNNKMRCGNCDFHLVYHKKEGINPTAECHYCGYSQPYTGRCFSCGADDVEMLHYGYGVERVAEEVGKLLPEARKAIITSDTLGSVKKSKEAIEKILAGEVDIIIGTQMIAKGLHFPNLHLVVIPEATPGYLSSDIRVMEKTYQLLHQVIGRAGRMETQGKVLLQTDEPNSPILKHIVSCNQQAFFDEEIEMRRMSHSPPFSRLALITCSGYDEITTLSVARTLLHNSPDRKEGFNLNLAVMGPSPAPLKQLKGQYRYRFIIVADKGVALQVILEEWMKCLSSCPRTVKIRVDIDPQNFF